MEITNNVLLVVAKQRACELENELISYKALCLQQDLEIKNLRKNLDEAIKKIKDLESKIN